MLTFNVSLRGVDDVTHKDRSKMVRCFNAPNRSVVVEWLKFHHLLGWCVDEPRPIDDLRDDQVEVILDEKGNCLKPNHLARIAQEWKIDVIKMRLKHRPLLVNGLGEAIVHFLTCIDLDGLIRDAHDNVVPVADREWLDLADAYLMMYAALEVPVEIPDYNSEDEDGD